MENMMQTLDMHYTDAQVMNACAQNLDAELSNMAAGTTASREEMAQRFLQSKNIRIHERRTSVRLEPEMWSALNEIAKLEGCTVHDLCGAVHDLKDPGASFTASLRVFMMEYYRSASRVTGRISGIQERIRSGQMGKR